MYGIACLCKFVVPRLATELLLFDQKRNESASEVEEETVQISDDYGMLSQSLDDLLADEGFAELDSSKVLTYLLAKENFALILYGIQLSKLYWLKC